MTIKKNRPADVEIQGKCLTANPFYARLDGHFTGPSGQRLIIPGFYGGNGIWKIRFSPLEPGTWDYKIHSVDIPEADGKTGSLSCRDENSCPGRLVLNRKYPGHFSFEDGTPHFMNAYECDWLWALDLGTEKLTKTKELVGQIKKRKFNTVIMNLYAHDCLWTPDYDKDYVYTPPALYLWEGSNEEPDHSRMNSAFFDHFDRLMEYLLGEQIMVHLFFKVYNKKVNYPEKQTPQDDLYFKYVTARYQAYPNLVWDFSKEAKNEADKEYSHNRVCFIKSLDAYDHLVTIHDDPGYFSDERRRKSVDFFTAQQHSSFFYSALAQKLRMDMPYFNSEFQYEHGPKGPEDITYGVSQTPEESIKRAWEVVLAGAYPAYYYTYTAWNVIDFRYEPPGMKYFEIMYDFITSLEWWKFKPSLEEVLPNTALAMARDEDELVIFSGIKDRPRNSIFVTTTWDLSLYEGFWMNIFTGEKKPVPRGDLARNGKGLLHLTIPYESTTGLLYLKRR